MGARNQDCISKAAHLITILHEGDYHCGSKLGLTPPDHVPPKMRPVLGKLWDWRERELKAVGPVDLHILNGDLTEGPGTKSAMGLLTANLDDQADWAIECAERVKMRPGGERRLTYGSDYHAVLSANVERQIAVHFKARIADTILLRVKGVRLNFRHFCGRSDIERGQFTQDAREITRALLQEVNDGFEAADIFGRSHVHYWSRVGIKDREAYTAPAWKLPLDDPGETYPRKLRGQYYDVGFVLIQIDNSGEVYIRPRKMRLIEHFPRKYETFGGENGS
jgi:hypothetical protein